MKKECITTKMGRRAGRLLPLCLFTFFLFAVQPADAQFLKRLFKKTTTNTEKHKVKLVDGINDDLQTPLADIAAQTDNSNNRNAFLGIPLGIKADRFERELLAKGFTERKAEGKQTGKSYIYDGDVYGSRSTVMLGVTDLTSRVFAVDVTDETIYNSKKEVTDRFLQVKKELQQVYGGGYVNNDGETYTILTRLGTIVLHYERGSLTSSYTLGFGLDDAKAYRMAYSEMDDKEHETPPRDITDGLAPACNHTDLVGLGVRLLQNRTVKTAQAVLKSYDYTVGKLTAKAVPATFRMEGYQSTASLLRRGQSITTITLTATDDAEAVKKDLSFNGFTSTDQKTWRQGRMVVTLSTDKQGRVVLQLK